MEVNRLALPKGFRLSNYELTRVLGKGGFGITYLGVDRHLGRRVAVKELMPDSIVARVDGVQVEAQSEELTTNWEWAKQRFLEEARVLAGFQHPNIVEVHQLIEANGTVYIVMDYIEGESYEERLRRIGHEPDEHRMQQLLRPLMDGLEEVHTTGLLHRDIKPDNILLRRGIQPILIDFGSARKLLQGTSVMTSLVTHGYSPIEQYQVKGKQGPWTDIYALACVAVRAITGEKPPMSADRVSEDDFVWLSYRGLKNFSPLFLQALDWALRVKPAERPQNIREWRASFGWEPKQTFLGKPLGAPAPGESEEKTSLELESPKTVAHQRSKTEPPAPPATARPITSRPVTSKPITTRPIPSHKAVSKPTTAKSPNPVSPMAHRPTATTGNGMATKANSPRGGNRFLSMAVGAAVLFSAGVFLFEHHSAKTALPSPAQAQINAKATTAQPLQPSPTPALFVNSLGMKFAPVPGTNLLFSIWDTRVADYRAFVQATGRNWRAPSFPQTPDHPAVNVSWEDANAFCQWLGEREGREYRLPTDAEWSLAAGLVEEVQGTPHQKDSHVKGVYPWGTAWPPPTNIGNYGHSRLMPHDRFEKTSPVGSFPANGCGLFDMGGNVWQWCQDCYDASPRRRVLRGGAWNSITQDILLSSFRYCVSPSDTAENIGFRCVTQVSGTQPSTP